MEKETLKRIFYFLEEKENKKAPFMWKYQNNIPLTEDDLNVKGDLNLWGIEIKSLPEGLKVGGDLKLEWTKIISLPEGLKVVGDLVISYTHINSLPKGSEIEGDLFIQSTPINEDYYDEEIREMIKPGFIKGEIIR